MSGSSSPLLEDDDVKSTWKFQRYPSIENLSDHMRKKFHYLEVNRNLYVVQEKIHGSNTAFWANSNTVLAARRSAWLAPGEKFHGLQEMAQGHEGEMAKKLFASVLIKRPCVTGVVIYGEYYGGYCPQKPVGGFRAVQKDVVYSPVHRFMAFDVAVVEPNQQLQFLDIWEAAELCASVGFAFCPTLFTGSLDECICYSEVHYADATDLVDPSVPPLLGGPPNVREGHVIRPVIPHRDPIKGFTLMYKHKNDHFKERVRTKKPCEPKQAMDGDVVKFALQFITLNRLKNVLSHQDYGSFSDVLEAYVKDALEDMEKEREGLILNDAEMKAVRSKASEYIRKEWVTSRE